MLNPTKTLLFPIERIGEIEREHRKKEEMDWSNIDLMESLPEEDRARMSAIIDQLQTRDALRIYNSLVQRCFSDCVNSFGRKALGKQEELCVRNCVHKILKLSTITGDKFSDFN